MATVTHQSTWDARIARARELASSRPAARDILTFYAALAGYQRALAASAGDALTFDVARVVEAIPDYLAWLRRNGPADLAASVEELDRPVLASLVASALTRVASAFRRKISAGRSLPTRGGSCQSEGGSHEIENPPTVFVVESLLQPCAEQLVGDGPAAPTPGSTPMRCPRCAALPVAAVLREEGHGARRFLLCALCLHEWECLRIVCPACGEQDFERLPVYTAEQFAHVRIDACDRCHHYVKTIDLTKDGLAVPCVDDIASVSLDLWAREHGYTRIKRNVLGI
jgi:formate dehydrogenase maturation protein FdhE